MRGECPQCSRTDMDLDHLGVCLDCLRHIKQGLNFRLVSKSEKFFIGWKTTPYELKKILNRRSNI